MSSSFSIDRRNESDEISIDWCEVLDSVDWSEETESVEDDNMSLSDFTDTDSLDTEHEMDVNDELDFIYGERDNSDRYRMMEDTPNYDIETMNELEGLRDEAERNKPFLATDDFEDPSSRNLRKMFRSLIDPMTRSIDYYDDCNPNNILYDNLLYHPSEATDKLTHHHTSPASFEFCETVNVQDEVSSTLFLAHDGANALRFVAAIFRENFEDFPLIARLCEYQHYPFLQGFNEVFMSALYYYKENILVVNDDGRLPLFVALAHGYEIDHNLHVIMNETRGLLEDNIVDPVWNMPAFAVAAAETDDISLDNPIGTQCNLTTIYTLLRSFPEDVKHKIISDH